MSDELIRGLAGHQRAELEAFDRGEGPESLVRPMADDERSAVLDAALSGLDEGSDEGSEGSDEAEEVPSIPANVVQTPWSRRTTVMIVATVLAAAAAVLLWWNLGVRRPDEADRIAALPSYTVTRLQAGAAQQRGADDPVPSHIQLTAAGRVRLVVTPATPSRTPVAVAVAARSSTGELRLGRPQAGVEVSPGGAIRLDGALRDFVPLDVGMWTVDVLIGPAAALPADVEAWRDAPRPPPWRVVSVQATIVADDP